MPHGWVRLTREPWWKRLFRFGRNTDEVFVNAALLGAGDDVAASQAA